MSSPKFPQVQYVTHEAEIPKLGRVKFRPFLVGEHKKLLESIALGDHNTVLNTLADILSACTFGKVNIDTTEMYVLDALYLEIFIHSRGSINKTSYTCNAQVKDENGETKTCGTEVLVNVPLDKAKMVYPEGYQETAVVHISENSGIKLRQATIEQYKRMKSDSEYSLSDEFLFACIECIYDGDRVMVPGKDFNLSELMEYLETFPDSIMEQVVKFFDNTPKLTLDIDIKCPKCGNEEKVTLQGLDDFFD